MTVVGPQSDLGSDFDNTGEVIVGPAGRIDVDGTFVNLNQLTVEGFVSIHGLLDLREGGRLTVPIEARPEDFGPPQISISSESGASMRGTLEVSTADGFQPFVGDRYQLFVGMPVLNFDSLVGVLPHYSLESSSPGIHDLVVIEGQRGSDLVVTFAEVDPFAVAGEPVGIRYEVRNTGAEPIVNGTWRDSIYLSEDRVFGPEDQLVTRIPRSGSVGAGETYQIDTSLPLPLVLDGSYYIIVVTDSRGQAADIDRGNNSRVSNGQVVFQIPELEYDVTVTDTIAAGQYRYYRIQSPFGQDLRFDLDFSVPVQASAYVRRTFIPTPWDFDFTSPIPAELHQEILIPEPLLGSYLILLHGSSAAGAGTPFTLTPRTQFQSVQEAAPLTGSNRGETTVRMSIAGFSRDVTATLIASTGARREAVQIVARDRNTIFATFDLTGLEPGAYSLEVSDDTQAAVFPAPFEVTQESVGRLGFDLQSPPIIRPGRPTLVTVTYSNLGATDIAAPLLILTAENATFYPGELRRETTSELLLLGLNPNGPLGTLPPGFQSNISIPFVPHGTEDGEQAVFRLRTLANPAEPFGWDDLTANSVPPGFDAAGWAERVAIARPALGETWGEVVDFVTKAAVAPIGGTTQEYLSFNEMLAYIISVYQPPTNGFASHPAGRPSLVAEPQQGGAPFHTAVEVQGNLVSNPERTFVITHGNLGTTSGDRFHELAAEIKSRYPNANVLLFDWSEGSNQAFGIPQHTSGNINPAGDALAEHLAVLQSHGFLDPGNSTFISESFGAYVNKRAAQQMGGVDYLLALNPASKLGGYGDVNLQDVSRHSVALTTINMADTNDKLADHTLLMDTPDDVTGGDLHTFGIPHMTNLLRSGNDSWLLDTNTLQRDESNDRFDGLVTLDGEYRRNDEFLRYFLEKWKKQAEETEEEDETATTIGTSFDPNELIGPGGFGAERFVPVWSTLNYRISFENLATASLPAQEVIITHQLDADLDWTTFTVGDIGFGETLVSVPGGNPVFVGRVDMTASLGFFVDITTSFDPASGQATWTFASIDPATGDLISDPLGGFLPPNVTPPEGDGFVTFSVRPRSDAASGTRVEQLASIVFDTNDAIITNTYVNTIDAGGPSSSVTELAPVLQTSSFLVSWSGHDDPGGSGIASYTIFVSVDGGPFSIWKKSTTETQALFAGEFGHTYAFYSIAKDNVGYVEATPLAADTQVSLTASSTHVLETLVNGPNNPNRSAIRELTITFDHSVMLADGGVLRLFKHNGVTPPEVFELGVDRLEAGSNGTATLRWVLMGRAAADLLLPDGRYTAELAAAATTPSLAQTLAFEFHRLAGDVDGDGLVNFNDYYEVRENFDASGVAYRPGDADGDGLVNFNDYMAVRDHFDAVLPALAFDFGDAPTAAQSGFESSYPTTLAANGARHVVTGNTLRLGASRDAEANGQPHATASGDGADENGIAIGNLEVGTTVGATVTVGGVTPALDVSPLLSLVTSAPSPVTIPTVTKLLREAKEDRLAESESAAANQPAQLTAPVVTGSRLSAKLSFDKD
ncbi:MAG: hypothetical protein KF861_12480 [Planctomycetaceae bacterium]|nr:hypothetical protein [Planctomycetaceae bacterium]